MSGLIRRVILLGAAVLFAAGCASNGQDPPPSVTVDGGPGSGSLQIRPLPPHDSVSGGQHRGEVTQVIPPPPYGYPPPRPMPTVPANPKATERDTTPELALRHYAALIAGMNADSIGAFYTPDGEMDPPQGPPIVGPAAISRLLSGFAQFHVLAERMISDGVSVRADTAQQNGRWWQTVVVPAGDTVNVDGTFAAEWRRVSNGTWRLRRMAAIGEP